MVRAEAVFESWRGIRDDTAQAVEEFPADQLDFKPVSELASFREIAIHILDASHAITGMMLAGMDDLTGPKFRELIPKYVTGIPATAEAATIAGELRSALDSRLAEFARQSAEYFSGMITRFDGQRVTRLEMLQWTKEHEIAHRSQLFMYLRLKGLAPATTRRRQARQKQG